MSVRREKRYGRWLYRKQVRLADGRRVRIFGVPTTIGLPNTKAGAEEAERREVNRVLSSGVVKPIAPQEKEVPTVATFSTVFLDVSRVDNKPSSVDMKESAFRMHLLPAFGELRLDRVTYSAIQDFKVKKVGQGLANKTINNSLTVLRRMLVVARKRGLIEVVPEVEWLKVAKPEFDFLTFEEAEQLLQAADGEWRTMILVALRTGMRQGELAALRWKDVDLNAGRIIVRQNFVRGRMGTPKSGKPREIPLGNDLLSALKRHRHLRGELVFCTGDGRLLRPDECKTPLWRACRKAGLRKIGWHALRHSFASHLVMKGVPLVAVQQLLGHSTIQMTMRYAHLGPEVTRDAVRMLDQKPRGSVVAASG